MGIDNETRIAELEQQLAEAKQQVTSLRLAVRAENLKVRISSEYSNFGLWEYDIADDICYQYKKLNGIYEANLDPIRNFRDTIISWGSVYADDIPVFHKMCDAMERGDKEIYYDVRVINDYSEIVWFRYEGKTIYDDNGKPLRIIGRTLDVTEEKGGVGTTSDSRHDALTGALVYESFAELAQQRAQEKGFKNSALFVVGLDNYNELCTSPECDIENMRRSIAKILESQSAVEQGSLFSYADDEKFVFYVKFSDIPNLNTIASRLIYRFYDFRLNNEATGKTASISVGISIFRANKSYDAVFTEACTALSVARSKGGNGYIQYNSSMASMKFASGANASKYDNVKGAAGAEAIYQLINSSLIDVEHCHEALVSSMREIGKYTGSSQVYFCRFLENGNPEMYMPWSIDGKNKYDPTLPSVLPICDQSKLCELLSKQKRITATVELGNISEYGLKFTNGAVCAVVSPVFASDLVAGYIAFVSDSIVTWQESDIILIDMLVNTLNRLFTSFYEKQQFVKRMDFAGAVINNLNIEGFTIEPDTYVVDYVGQNAERAYGLKHGDVCYRKIRGTDKPCEDCPTHQLKAGQLNASCAHYYEKSNRWVDIAASPYDNKDGKERFAVSTTDITNCISKIQTRDTLTGALGFDKFALDAMRITAQNPDCGFITVINIANFRRLNETKGYEFGNSVLIAVSDVLSSTLGYNELLCRSEGARFIALYRNGSSDELLTRLKQMLQSAQSQVLEKCGMQIYLIAGAYELSGESPGIMSSLDRAIIAQKTVKDKAYYTSNMIAFYDNALREELQTRQYIEAHMLEALENDEFKVFYQPKVNPITGEIKGAEALVRWIRPNGEMISPGKFVPLFEQNGFIADMDFAIYRRAIADIKRWMRDGIEVPLISLNVSRHHMRDESFPDKICALVDNLGVPRDKIELEITESMLTENMNKLLDSMTQLKEAGFHISVDDFGSGYSSLNLITLLPFDTLKIDGGFFLKNTLTEKNKKVITSIVDLAKNLNFSTVSEGVETDEQVNFLRELGCDMIQGYYYYKPMPVSSFEEILRSHE